jgi:predicted nucleotidyltransferase
MTRSESLAVTRGVGWQPDVVARLGLDESRERRLADFCARWLVVDLELVGSVLRPDFGPESDIDVLVPFLPEADWGLIEHAAMEEELTGLLGRPVDLLTRRAVERSANHQRRASILASAVPLLQAANTSTALGRVNA